MGSNSNDFLGDIIKRVKELADLSMPQLRSAGGYDCDSEAQARTLHKGKTRGEIIEFILVEEFSEEFPREFAE